MNATPQTRQKHRPKRKGQRSIRERLKHHGMVPYLNAFLESLRILGLSEQTLDRKEQALQRFLLWCDERALEDPRSITKPILTRYQKHLFHHRKADGEPLSHASQRVLLTILKGFFSWLNKENHIASNPASELDLPKVPKRLPRVILSREEVKTILDLPNPRTVHGLRDKAILETLYSTGIRRMELANLSLYDVDTQHQTLFVREGKGGKDRLLPLGENAAYWIKRYQHEARPQLIVHPTHTLFLTNHGEAWGRDLSELVKRYCYHARIDKPGACHLLRHAMATHMLDNGADIRFIQQMLGHASLATTQIYTHVSIEKLREIHRATHPANQAQRESLLAALEAEEAEDGLESKSITE